MDMFGFPLEFKVMAQSPKEYPQRIDVSEPYIKYIFFYYNRYVSANYVGRIPAVCWPENVNALLWNWFL